MNWIVHFKLVPLCHRYAYIVGSNEASHNMDKIVATTNPYVNSEYLRLYPGMTAENLKSNGIMEVPGEN